VARGLETIRIPRLQAVVVALASLVIIGFLVFLQRYRGADRTAMALSLLMWLIAFLAVGGEWFLMWQSRMWNGQDAAFRMFTVIGIVLLLVAQSDAGDQP
jgi:high-affinity Fe2+/Pb2+ permease